MSFNLNRTGSKPVAQLIPPSSLPTPPTRLAALGSRALRTLEPRLVLLDPLRHPLVDALRPRLGANTVFDDDDLGQIDDS